MFERQSHTYANGARLLRVSAPLHMATVHVTVGVGSRHEDAARSGIAHLSEHVRFRGTQRFPSGTAVNSAFEVSGGDHNAVTGSEAMSFYASALPEEICNVAELIADLVARPLFRETDLEQERPIVLQEISTRRSVLEDAIMQSIFGAHPAAQPIPGSRASVSRIQAAHLRQHHHTHFVGPNVVAVVVAPEHVSTDSLVNALGALAELSAESAPPTLAFDGHTAPFRVRHVAGAATTPSVTLLYPSCGHRAPEAMVTSLLAALLQRISGPIFQRLRHELGLLYHYDVTSFQVAEGGGLVVRYQVRDAEVVRATHEMLRSLHQLGRTYDSIAKQAFEATQKASLTWAARLCDNSEDLAAFYASELLWYSNLTPMSWVAQLSSVTDAAVNARALEVFQPAHVRLITSGKIQPKTRMRLVSLIGEDS